jgi:hypothetical protein
MDVTLTDDVINITKDDLLIATIAPYQITSVTAHRRPDREIGPPVTTISFNNSAWQRTTSPYAQTPTWYVVIHLSDGRTEWIQMGIVVNQAGWTNDAAGAEAARAAIVALLPVAA